MKANAEVLGYPVLVTERPRLRVKKQYGQKVVSVAGMNVAFEDETHVFTGPKIIAHEGIGEVCRANINLSRERLPLIGHDTEKLDSRPSFRRTQLRFIYLSLRSGGKYVVVGEDIYGDDIEQQFGQPEKTYPYYNEKNGTTGKVVVYKKG